MITDASPKFRLKTYVNMENLKSALSLIDVSQSLKRIL